MKTRAFSSLVVAAVAVLSFSKSAEAAVSIVNPSFEDAPLGDGVSAAGATGWVNASGGRYNPTDAQFPGAGGAPGTIPGGDGVQVAYMNGAGGMSQNIGTIEANSNYELTVAIGERLDLGWSNLTVTLWGGSVGGTSLASQVYTAADAPDGSFSDVSFGFSSAAFPGEVGNALHVQFQSGVQALYDNVRITETLIPEPSTFALVGLGGLALIARRRRE